MRLFSFVRRAGATRRLSTLLRPSEESDAVFAISYPGSRVLELSNPAAGNELTTYVTMALQEKLRAYEGNAAVSAIFFASQSADVFSTAAVGSSAPDKKGMQSLSNFVQALAVYKKPTLAVYSGRMNGTAYAAFAGSKYLLGGPSLSLVVDELSVGKIPSAGFAFQFKKCGAYGAAMARYFAVSRRDVRGDDLYALGLLTHLVEDAAHLSLADALAHTIPSRADLETHPGAVVVEGAIAELLDTMDVHSDINPMTHEMWDKLVLVPPGRADTIEPGGDEDGPDDLFSIKDDVARCFSGTPEMAIKRLSDIKQPWAVEAIESMSRLDRGLLNTWWTITESITFPGIKMQDILRLEVEAHAAKKP